MEPFLGEIRVFAGSFAPRGWALCSGQVLPISQNVALFSLLGVTFGGDGRTNFKLPDFQGRVPVGQGQGPGLSAYTVGQVGGEASHTLISSEMAAHNHPFNADNSGANQNSPANNMFGGGGRNNRYFGDGTNAAPFAAGSVGSAGGSQDHENRQPYLTLNYIIALQGIFPTRP